MIMDYGLVIAGKNASSRCDGNKWSELDRRTTSELPLYNAQQNLMAENLCHVRTLVEAGASTYSIWIYRSYQGFAPHFSNKLKMRFNESDN
jgi:hypothetical protein